MKEGELKLTVDQYLRFGENMGKWMYLRLNAGDFIEVRGKTRRRIKGCPEGTADFVVIRKDTIQAYPTHMCVEAPQVIFLELKSAKGRTSPAQGAFAILVENQGASYHIIRSIEGLMDLLEVKDEKANLFS